MKWIILVFALLPASAFATLINYRFAGGAEYLDVSGGIDHPISIDVSVNTDTGQVFDASAAFLGSNWTQTAAPQYIYEQFVGIDGSTLMHWLAWTLELTNGSNTLSFGPHPEWKVPYLGDNPLTRLEDSVAIAGLILVDGQRYGPGLSVHRVPEPNSLALVIAALFALLVLRFKSFRSA